MAAQREVLRQYAHAHDHWSEQEQVMATRGQTADATLARERAIAVLGAWLLERDDPPLEGLME